VTSSCSSVLQRRIASTERAWYAQLISFAGLTGSNGLIGIRETREQFREGGGFPTTSEISKATIAHPSPELLNWPGKDH